jgi:peptidyl-dipeptidase Dcp
MPNDFDVVKFEEKNLAGRRGLFPEIAPRYRYTYFAHIFNGGYSSGYYFYLWAEVLDKDAFAAFKERRDICDTELANIFRYELLAQGGQRPGMEMYRKFRGADPNKEPMLRARGLWREPEVVEVDSVDTAEYKQMPVLESEAMLSDNIKSTPGKPVLPANSRDLKPKLQPKANLGEKPIELSGEPI